MRMAKLTCATFQKLLPDMRKGYCELRLPDVGIVIRDVAVHVFDQAKPPRCWVSMPAREYTDRNGERKFWAFLWFDRDANEQLQDQAREQLKKLAPEIFAGTLIA